MGSATAISGDLRFLHTTDLAPLLSRLQVVAAGNEIAQRRIRMGRSAFAKIDLESVVRPPAGGILGGGEVNAHAPDDAGLSQLGAERA